MNLPINSITQRKLVLVKQLFENASMQASSRYSPVSRIMAVIGFDLSVETMLKIIVSALTTEKQPETTFQAIVQQVNSKLEKEGYSKIPDEGNIQYVRGIRNDAQHKAKYPTDEDVKECQVFIHNFLKKVTVQLWDIDFDNISTLELVQNPNAKRLLTIANNSFQENDYENTIRQSHAALIWTISRVKNRMLDDYGLNEEFDFSEVSESVDNNLASAINTGFEPVREEISNGFSQIQEALLAISVGMNYAQFVRLQMILPDYSVSFDENGNPIVQLTLFKMKKNVSKRDAQFALNYCIDSVIQIESQISDLENEPPSHIWEF